MKYAKEERLAIGRKIYDDEFSRSQAAEQYGISPQTARDYMRLYRDVNHLPPKRKPFPNYYPQPGVSAPSGLEGFENMSKEELIRELVKARIAEARLKKVTR